MSTHLSDDAVVVRGGQSRDPEQLLEKLLDALEDYGVAALSVYCVEPVEGARDAAVLGACVAGDVPHTKIQVASLGDLRAAGFSVLQDMTDGQPACHHNVIFGNEVGVDDAERFIRCFHEPMPNPTGGKRRTK